MQPSTIHLCISVMNHLPSVHYCNMNTNLLILYSCILLDISVPHLWSVSVSLIHLCCFPSVSFLMLIEGSSFLCMLFFHLLFFYSYFCGASTATYLYSFLVPAQSAALMGGGNMSQILNDFLSVLCFTSSRLASGIHTSTYTHKKKSKEHTYVKYIPFSLQNGPS